MDRADRTRLWIDAGLVLGWAGLVWVLGGADFSAAQTSRILGPLLEWLFPDWTPEARGLWAGALRKLAHPVEYGVFAVLALRFVDRRQRLRFGRSPVWLAMATALSFATMLAVLDESRQRSLASRTGSPWDVALDVAGAALALGLAVGAATWAGRPLLGVPGWRDDARPAPPASSEPPAP